jgi:hypothetical protein
LYLIVVGFAVGEDFADVVDWSLYFVDMLGFLPLHYQGGATWVIAAMYRRRISPGSGEASI